MAAIHTGGPGRCTGSGPPIAPTRSPKLPRRWTGPPCQSARDHLDRFRETVHALGPRRIRNSVTLPQVPGRVIVGSDAQPQIEPAIRAADRRWPRVWPAMRGGATIDRRRTSRQVRCAPSASALRVRPASSIRRTSTARARRRIRHDRSRALRPPPSIVEGPRRPCPRSGPRASARAKHRRGLRGCQPRGS